MKHPISRHHLSLSQIRQITGEKRHLELSEESLERINGCRTFLDRKLQSGDLLYYGINTGFGSLRNVRISGDDLERLQENLVMSHACGVGDPVPAEIVKLMLLLKIQSLSYGNSAVDAATVWRLIDFYNHDVLPVVYQKGSLGASGDLAPLAHLSLPLLGLGEGYYGGKTHPAAEILEVFGWKPLKLKSKEGLALLNGTQFMSAYAAFILLQTRKISLLADLISAVSMDAFQCRREPFHLLLHQARPHPGQLETAAFILQLLQGSPLSALPKQDVQDPYSFRCIPQVHGASKDTFKFVESVVTTEINSVTDNPVLFPQEDLILSGGNFHGQPLALALDFLSMALAELGSISERRTYLLVSGQRDLPPYLIAKPGLHSGLMIPQYTAAALVSENKQLCTPASVDSLMSSNGQEDHVSMGANAATKCFRVLDNLKTILAVELLTAAQALEFRRPLETGRLLEKFLGEYRKQIPFNDSDRVLHNDLITTRKFLDSVDLPDPENK